MFPTGIFTDSSKKDLSKIHLEEANNQNGDQALARAGSYFYICRWVPVLRNYLPTLMLSSHSDGGMACGY